MAPAHHSTRETQERAALIHREILQLGVLMLVAVAAFFVTRAVAANNRQMNLHDAEEWYHRGQAQVDAGQVSDAIDSLRRAAVRNRNEPRYVLALARALALHHDDEAARSALLTLREAAPEDPHINLELARLAAHRQDVTEALRFYHNALYAPWPVEQADARRRIRFELIDVLLAHDQRSRALPELLALSTDLPDEPALRLEVAQRFASAGDHVHALDQYQRALRRSPESREALAGAGHAAFQLGDFTLARTYLRRLPSDATDGRRTREIVDLVLSSDPLATRLGSAERRRRLRADVSYAQQRLRECLAQRSEPSIDGDLTHQAQAFEDQLKRPAVLEQDTVEMGVDLIDRLERQVAGSCGPLTPLDQALALIGRVHGAPAR